MAVKDMLGKLEEILYSESSVVAHDDVPRMMLVVAQEVKIEKDAELLWLKQFMSELKAQIEEPGEVV